MADTPKKRTTTPKAATADKAATTSKPRKTAAKKSANGMTADPVSSNGHALAQRSATHDEVASLAHAYWQDRGGKHGYHMEDWFRAEQELRGKA
jgi:Protein of unknown function (DUF2934)